MAPITKPICCFEAGRGYLYPELYGKKREGIYTKGGVWYERAERKGRRKGVKKGE